VLDLGWRYLIPMALINLLITGFLLYAARTFAA